MVLRLYVELLVTFDKANLCVVVHIDKQHFHTYTPNLRYNQL